MTKEFDPDKLKRFPVLFVRLESPAAAAIMRSYRRRGKMLPPGAVLLVSDEEFESLQVDVLGYQPEGETDGTG